MFFTPCKNILLKVSLTKGVMQSIKKGSLVIGTLVYLRYLMMLVLYLTGSAFPPGLSKVHQVFHITMLKKYPGYSDNIIKWDSNLIDKTFLYEEKLVEILDRDVQKLITKEIQSMKVW